MCLTILTPPLLHFPRSPPFRDSTLLAAHFRGGNLQRQRPSRRCGQVGSQALPGLTRGVSIDLASSTLIIGSSPFPDQHLSLQSSEEIIQVPWRRATEVQ